MLSPSPVSLVASPREQSSLSPAEAPAFHLEWITDWEYGFRLIREHRLFEMSEYGWGLMKKAHLHADLSEFVPLLMILAWDTSHTHPVGVVLVERHRVRSSRLWFHQTMISVLDVYVAPSHRRLGIARALVKRAAAAFPWASAHHNEESKTLYQEFGLQDVFAVHEFLDEHFDLNHMKDRKMILRAHRRYRDVLRAVVKAHANNPYVEAEARDLWAESIKESQANRSLPSL